MTDTHRTQPPYRGTEKETLYGFLQFLRETIVQKCHGLTDEQMQLTPTVSSMNLLAWLST